MQTEKVLCFLYLEIQLNLISPFGRAIFCMTSPQSLWVLEIIKNLHYAYIVKVKPWQVTLKGTSCVSPTTFTLLTRPRLLLTHPQVHMNNKHSCCKTNRLTHSLTQKYCVHLGLFIVSFPHISVLFIVT